jgi:hypothetical protein
MVRNLWARIAPFYDPTAWVLIIVCAGGVAMFDPVMAKTVLQWVLLFGVFAGVAVIISRHVFPQISLSAHVEAALAGNVGAGLVVAGICLFMSFLVLAITLWGKA